MTTIPTRLRPLARLHTGLLGAAGAALLIALAQASFAQEPAPPPAPAPAPAAPAAPGAAPAAAATDSGKKLPPEQLQSLVAPIALYPDALLAQVLVASTYPLEIVQLQQWLAKNPGLKDSALADSVGKQPWDPSIQSMAPMPDVVKRLADDIQWTTQLGNAFLAQQGDVMDAVQVMRKKAEGTGALKSNEQQKVETKTVEQKQVIVVESTNPEVIYVPSYSPTVVYPPPVYPYPPIYYPPYPPGAAMMTFAVGMAWGAAMWGGPCCGAGWGGNTVVINNNNNFNRVNHNNINNGNRNNINNGNRGNNNWQHNPEHRGGAPYADQRTADKFGGNDRGAGSNNRAGVSDRASGPGQGQRGGAGVSDRSSGPGAGGAGAGNRAGPSAGSDKIGSRDIPRDAGGAGGGNRPSTGGVGGGSGGLGGSSNGFGGGSGFNGSSARASSSRGAGSMGGGRGGGGGRRR